MIEQVWDETPPPPPPAAAAARSGYISHVGEKVA